MKSGRSVPASQATFETVEDRKVEPPRQPSLRLVRIGLADGDRMGAKVEIVRYRISRRT